MILYQTHLSIINFSCKSHITRMHNFRKTKRRKNIKERKKYSLEYSNFMFHRRANYFRKYLKFSRGKEKGIIVALFNANIFAKISNHYHPSLHDTNRTFNQGTLSMDLRVRN